jgi:type I restriction enzyme, S subunit
MSSAESVNYVDGSLPRGWKRERVEDCLSPDEIERRPSVPRSKYRKKGRFPVVDQGQGLIAGFTDDGASIHRDDLPLIVFGDHTRAVKFVDFPFATGADGTKLLRPSTQVDARFFYYALLNIELPSRGYNRHFSLLREKSIDFPSDTEEQRAVAGVLSKLQRRVEVQHDIAMTLKELKAATIAKLFREGLRGEPLKETEIGEVPRSWDVVPFGRVVDIAEGQVDPRAEPYTSMLHVGPEDVEEGTGRLLTPRIARDLALISGKYAFQSGDIIFSKIRPYLRKSVLADFKGICSADMYPLRPKPNFEGRFVHALTLSPNFTAQAVSQQDRTGIPKLNREQLRNIYVPQPSESEQQEIGRLFATIDRRLVITTQYQTLLTLTFESVLNRVVTGAIRLQISAKQSR